MNHEKSHIISPIDNLEMDSILARAQRHTGLPAVRLVGVGAKIEDCVDKNVPGCFIECGVQHGGTVGFMKLYSDLVTSKAGKEERQVWAFDSFDGMPIPSAKDIDQNGTNALENYNRGITYPVNTIERYNETLVDLDLVGKVNTRKGWFKDTLVNFPGPIAVLRADGDWYSSTMDILGNLYDQVSPGGYIIFDDYGWWKGCKEAVDEFIAKRNLQVEIQITDKEEVWFQKPVPTKASPAV